MPTDRSNQVTPGGDWNMLSGSSFDELIAKIKRNKPLAGQNVTTEETKDGVIINFSSTTGACCNGGICSIKTDTACIDSGGTFQGVNTVCDPNPCNIVGACCSNGICTEITEADCDTANGIYAGDGTTCDVNPCPTGACCFSTSCEIRTQNDCEVVNNGHYQGDGTVCDPNPCHSGACCQAVGHGCGNTTEEECVFPDSFFPGQRCDDVPTPCVSPCCCGIFGDKYCNAQENGYSHAENFGGDVTRSCDADFYFVSYIDGSCGRHFVCGGTKTHSGSDCTTITSTLMDVGGYCDWVRTDGCTSGCCISDCISCNEEDTDCTQINDPDPGNSGYTQDCSWSCDFAGGYSHYNQNEFLCNQCSAVPCP